MRRTNAYSVRNMSLSALTIDDPAELARVSNGLAAILGQHWPWPGLETLGSVGGLQFTTCTCQRFSERLNTACIGWLEEQAFARRLSSFTPHWREGQWWVSALAEGIEGSGPTLTHALIAAVRAVHRLPPMGKPTHDGTSSFVIRTSRRQPGDEAPDQPAHQARSDRPTDAAGPPQRIKITPQAA